MEHRHCLNCATPLIGSYCHRCGQKGATHRLTIRHFIEHDLIHGIWHLDKGILRTLRDILTRPGYLARDYIAGKRTGHFNLVTLLVLLATLFLFTTHHTDPASSNFMINGKKATGLVAFASSYSKWLILVAIPIMSIATRQILKRLQYNVAEHLVMCGYFVAGALCIMIAFRLIYQIPHVLSIYTLLLEILAIAVYLGLAFMQIMDGAYSTARAIGLYLLILFSFIGYLLAFAFSIITIYHYAFL